MYSGEITQSQINTPTYYYLLLNKLAQQDRIRPFSNFGFDILVDVWMPEESTRENAHLIIDLAMTHRVGISNFEINYIIYCTQFFANY